MKTNKSIDGLKSRDAKVSASEPFVEKISPTTKPKTKPKSAKLVQVESPEPKKPEEDLLVSSETLSESHEQAIEDFLKPVQAFDFDEDSKELTASKETTMKKDTNKKHQKEKKKPSKARRIITTILLLIVLAAIGFVIWGIFWGNDIIAKITGGQGNVFDLFTLTTETYEPLKTDANGRTNILAFGTSGYNMQGDEGDGVHDGAQLTDSIMMISINQETGDIAMLSLPRDLKASPTCTATGKINEIYWCNNMYGDDEAAGATALMTEVGSVLGVDFQYYAHLNWGALVDIIDMLGGIKVTLDEDIEDYNYTGALYEAGVEYTLDGDAALGLARARHGTIGGDFSRGASQQKILIGIKDKIYEKNISLTDMLGLASSLGDNLRTNLSLSELKTLAHLTFEFDFENARQISLYNPLTGVYYMTTANIDGISYVVPYDGVGNYGSIQEFVAEELAADPALKEPEQTTEETAPETNVSE